MNPERLQKLYDQKKHLLEQKGHYSLRQLEDAFHQRQSGTYLKDCIFGANDGIVTTFAVIAGAAGAGLSSTVIIILGVANLVADGLSMGLGNYLGERSDAAYNKGQREKELWEVEHFPEIEEAEVRGILQQRYNFQGEVLDSAMKTLMADKQRWVEFMMREELDIIEDPGGAKAAAKHGVVMFCAFVAAGAVPLLPFLIPGVGAAFSIALVLAGLTFFTIGSLRSRLTSTPWWRSGFEVLLIGALASGASYALGALLENLIQ